MLQFVLTDIQSNYINYKLMYSRFLVSMYFSKINSSSNYNNTKMFTCIISVYVHNNTYTCIISPFICIINQYTASGLLDRTDYGRQPKLQSWSNIVTESLHSYLNTNYTIIPPETNFLLYCIPSSSYSTQIRAIRNIIGLKSRV